MPNRGRKPILSAADVAEIREMYANKTDPIGWTVTSIARVMKISTGLVNKALNGTAAVKEDELKMPKTMITEIADVPKVRQIFFDLKLTPKFIAWYNLPFVVESLNMELNQKLHDALDEQKIYYRVVTENMPTSHC